MDAPRFGPSNRRPPHPMNGEVTGEHMDSFSPAALAVAAATCIIGIALALEAVAAAM